MNTIVLFYPRVPQLFTKGWPTHTKKYRSEMVAAVTAAATVLCAKQQQIIAQRRTSPVLCKLCSSSKYFYFYLFQGFLVWQTASRRAGQSPFSWHDLHHPHYPRKSPFTRLYCQPKTPLFWATKRQLNLIKGKAKYKMQPSSRKREAPHNDCSMAGECGVKTS